MLEQHTQRQVDTKVAADPRDYLGAEQRMPAEGEEMVGTADPLDPQHRFPDPRQQLFVGMERRLETRRLVLFGSRQGRSIDLAVHIQGQGLEEDHLGRDHGFRQALPEAAAQSFGVRGRQRFFCRLPLDIGHQADPAAGALPRQDRRRADSRQLLKSRFHLSRLDPHTEHLDLVVGPAEELEAAVGQGAGAVAGAVGPAARNRRKGIGDEARGRAPGPAEVSTGQVWTADPELSHRPQRHRTQGTVEEVEPALVDGSADGHAAGARGRGHPLRARGHHRLARTVLIEDRGVGKGFARPLAIGGEESLTADQHPAHRGARPAGPDQGPQHRGHDAENRRDTTARGELHQRRGIPPRLRCRQLQGRPRHQGTELIANRGVESDRRQLQNSIVGPERMLLPQPAQVGDGSSMAAEQALGTPGGSRGVDQIRELFGAEEGAIGGLGIEVSSRDHRSLEGGAAIEPGLFAHHQRRPTVGEDEGQPLRRRLRIQGHMGTPRGEDAEQGGDPLRRPLHHHRHPHLGPDTESQQGPGDTLDPSGQRSVAQALVSPAHRNRLRLPRRPFEDELVQSYRRPRPRRVVPLHEQLSPFLRRQQRQLRDSLFRIGHGGGEQGLQVTDPAGGGGGVEELGAVLEGAADLASLALAQREREIELRGRALDLQGLQDETRQRQGPGRSVLEDEHHLEERRPGRVPVGLQLLHQLLERQPLVSEGAERRLPHSLQELPKARSAAEIRS